MRCRVERRFFKGPNFAFLSWFKKSCLNHSNVICTDAYEKCDALDRAEKKSKMTPWIYTKCFFFLGGYKYKWKDGWIKTVFRDCLVQSKRTELGFDQQNLSNLINFQKKSEYFKPNIFLRKVRKKKII
jgi:hypothetical protein